MGQAVQDLDAFFHGHHVQLPVVIAHAHCIRLLLLGQVPAQLIEQLLETKMLNEVLIEIGHVTL